MNYCKTIKEKYHPYLGEVVPYGRAFVWKGYYLTASKTAHHGVSFSQDTAFVSDDEREKILNKHLIKREVAQKTDRSVSNNYRYSATSTWGNFTNVTFTIG